MRSSSITPARSLRIASRLTSPSTRARYVLLTSRLGCSMRCIISPSFVSKQQAFAVKVKPALPETAAPGNRGTGPAPLRAPAGRSPCRPLPSAYDKEYNISFLRASSVSPSRVTTSPSSTCVPSSVTTAAVYRHASSRDKLLALAARRGSAARQILLQSHLQHLKASYRKTAPSPAARALCAFPGEAQT